MTPTQRTLKALKDQGFKCGIVERWISFGRRRDGQRGIRKDLFGIIDIVALDFSRGFIGVQSTGTGFSAHHKEITQDLDKIKAAINWLSTPGGHLELWGWRKVNQSKTSKRKVYRPRVKVYTLADFIDPFEL